MITEIVFNILFALVSLFTWAIILSAIISTLLSFNVLDRSNRAVWSIADFLARVTEPVLRPIRRVMPNFGNFDLSPLVALLLLQYAVKPILAELYAGIRFGVWPPLF